MEIVIAGFIQKQLNEFIDDTGLCPEQINVDMSEVTSHGDKVRMFVVTDVKSTVEL